MEEIKRRKGKIKVVENQEGRQTMRDYGLQKEGTWGMCEPGDGTKEGTDCMEHWVLYANSESWNTTSKTNDVRYGD